MGRDGWEYNPGPKCCQTPSWERAKIETVLSENGREFCGRPDQDPYELFLQLEDINHRTTRVKRSQPNGIVERLHRTLLDEHFRDEGRRIWFETINEMQTVLDDYLVGYNQRRPHKGRGMNSRTRATAFVEDLATSQKRREGKKAEKQTTQRVARNRPLAAALSADYPLCTANAVAFSGMPTSIPIL